MKSSYIRTKTIRLKNSLALKGRKMSEEQKTKLRLGWIKRKEKGLGIPWNKGKKETREDVLAKLKARRHTEESKKKMSLSHKLHPSFNWMKGKKHTSESRIKMSAKLKGRTGWNKGKKGLQIAWNKGIKNSTNGHLPRSESWRKKLSESKKGSLNPSWCGGIARKKYPFHFNSSLKMKIRVRDGHICQLCGEKKKKMDVHHIDYDKNNSSEENLILLCASCHIKTNIPRKREFYIKLLSEKVQRL